MLPKFSGHEREDPYTHLHQFVQICSTLNETKLGIDGIRLRLFPFSLNDKASQWLHSLAGNSIRTWDQLNTKFLTKFYPMSRTIELRNKIQTFKQKHSEEFYEAWERFGELQIQCPHHQIPLETLVQCFYNGLNSTTRGLVESMNEGQFLSKTATQANDFFIKLADNSQHWGNSTNPIPGVYEVKQTAKIEQDGEVKTLIKNLAKKVEALSIQSNQPNTVMNVNELW